MVEIFIVVTAALWMYMLLYVTLLQKLKPFSPTYCTCCLLFFLLHLHRCIPNVLSFFVFSFVKSKKIKQKG